jgi:Cytochrome c3/Cytochrome c7 and related cytochrome c
VLRTFLRFAIFLFAAQVYAQNPSPPAQKPVTRNPHGRTLNIPCENCHTSLSWKPIRSIPEFEHDTTRYPLRGMHEKVACTQCHVKLVFANVGQKCADCHADIHRAQFGSNCESCHTVKGWTVTVQAIRDHQNRFPLIGAHAAVECESCHKGAATGQFQGLSAQCYSCHAKDFKTATNPNHVTAGFSTSCESCHGTNTWLDAKFDHASVGFPLTNAHSDPPRVCLDCHVNNNYNLTSTACATCHLKDFQGAKNPNHVAGGFSQTCQQCHTTIAWQPATFNHTSVGFPLTNAHADPPRVCLDCHIDNNYNLTTTACSSCHLKDYNTATAPVNHVQMGFPTACESCHDTVVWTDGKFDHSATGFPLTNSHTVPPRACADCHVNNNYSLTSANTACVSCHLNAYNAATTPINHVQVGFPTTCQLCHDTTLWTNGKFDHNTTTFPLTGFHVQVACASCHVNNNYTTLPTDCYGCHKAAYDGTTNPIHKAAPTVFTTACATCHNTTAWTGATFNHTWFPMTHGRNAANGVCSVCHTSPNDYTIFQCTGCHGGGNPNNFRHPNVGGYVYNSVNCYQCHRNAP